MLSYATQGYVAVIPDYAGFNDDSRLQAYFVADLEARVLLDAARAVFAFFAGGPGPVTPRARSSTPATPRAATPPSPRGTSWRAYAPDVPMTGVIGHGASTDVTRCCGTAPTSPPTCSTATRTTTGRRRWT